MSEQVIKVKKSELPTFRVRLSPDRACCLVVQKSSTYFGEFGDALFRYNSAVLLPAVPPSSPEATVRPGLTVIAACLDYATKHPGKMVVIAGHTDTVGSAESNVTLSGIRADAVHGLLTGDREQFAKACHGPHLSDEQRYPDGGSGKKKGVCWDDYTDVLNWTAVHFGWPCGFPKGNSSLWGATSAFQKSYNHSDFVPSSGKGISESGKFDIATWGAVYDCYEKKLSEMLKVDKAGLGSMRKKFTFLNSAPAKHCVACGEFKPIEEEFKDNYLSQTNRRVEVQFFDRGEEPQLPCLSGACEPAQCWLDSSDHYRLKHVPTEIGSPAPTTGDMARFRLHDSDANPMPDTFYRFKMPGDSDWTRSQQADGDGWAEIPTPAQCLANNTVTVQWEMFGDDEGADRYIYARELHIDCNATATNDGQLRLSNLGYADPDYAANVREFQRDYGIVESGYGPLTRAKLDSLFTPGVCDARRA